MIIIKKKVKILSILLSFIFLIFASNYFIPTNSNFNNINYPISSNVAPVVSITSPSNEEVITSALLTINAHAEDDDFDLDSVVCWIENTTFTSEEYLMIGSGDYSKTLFITGYENGIYQIYVRANDSYDEQDTEFIDVEFDIQWDYYEIELDGNEDVDSFFSGDGTDGLSYETAHNLKDVSVEFSIRVYNNTRYIIFDNIFMINALEGSSIGGKYETDLFYIWNSSNIYIQNSTLIQHERDKSTLECQGFDNNDNVNLFNITTQGYSNEHPLIHYTDMTDCDILYCNISSQYEIIIESCDHFDINYNYLDNSVDVTVYFFQGYDCSYINLKGNYDSIDYEYHGLIELLNSAIMGFSFNGMCDHISIENNNLSKLFFLLQSDNQISNLNVINNYFWNILIAFEFNITSNILIQDNIMGFILNEELKYLEGGYFRSGIVLASYTKLGSNVDIEDNAFIGSPQIIYSDTLGGGEPVYQGEHECQFRRNYYDNYLLSPHSSYEIDLDYFYDPFLIDNLTYLQDLHPRWHFERFGKSYSLNDKPILTDYQRFFYGDSFEQNLIIWEYQEDLLHIDPYYQIYFEGELIINDSVLTEEITFDILSLGELNQGTYNLTIIYYDGIGEYSEYTLELVIFNQNNLWMWLLGILIPIIGILSIPTTLYFIGRKKIAPKKVSAKIGKITCKSLGGLYNNGLCTLKKKI